MAPWIGAADRKSAMRVEDAFGSLQPLADARVGRRILPRLAVEPGAIGKLVFHEVVIENVAVLLSVADLPSPHALRSHWVRALEPAGDIEVVAMLLHVVIAG